MVAASFLFFAPSVRAEDLGWRTILDIGCHHVNGTCYLTLSGGSFNGDRACAVGPTNEVRWDNANQDDGKRSFAALFGAFLAGKTVQIVTSGCTAQNVPTILYYHIR